MTLNPRDGYADRAIDAAPGPFGRHLDRCNSARLPGDRKRFRLGSLDVGWVGATIAAALAEKGVADEPEALVLDDPERLPGLARELATAGLFRHRGEAFDVRAVPDGPVLTSIDRGAIPAFGILAEGVHLNGLVDRADGIHLWVGRRADDKLLDPGKLDHLVAGGIAAGHGVRDTLEKEGHEESNLPPELARQAEAVSIISYAMERPEGLRRDRLHCFDLWLPEDFRPHANDGEVAEFILLPLPEIFRLVRDTDRFKFNVNLVLIDLFLRLGLIAPTGSEGVVLSRMLERQLV
ncbi:thiamine pyrophosphokinase [Rhizosaccharibacter radicis]|uniref:Thiamine pyrophosphokinase n=1 Tax=Rhizosaccharibacter radicis TaxID=2782605 RepID=A0ABT1W0J6_9PROT|nr:thiamine pyrophosphokinase [Acetobacteraceae bacterium KSS12]